MIASRVTRVAPGPELLKAKPPPKRGRFRFSRAAPVLAHRSPRPRLMGLGRVVLLCFLHERADPCIAA